MRAGVAGLGFLHGIHGQFANRARGLFGAIDAAAVVDASMARSKKLKRKLGNYRLFRLLFQIRGQLRMHKKGNQDHSHYHLLECASNARLFISEVLISTSHKSPASEQFKLNPTPA